MVNVLLIIKHFAAVFLLVAIAFLILGIKSVTAMLVTTLVLFFVGAFYKERRS